MKLVLRLPDALHARPANLLVRVARTHRAEIVIRKGGCAGSAKNILEVLSLGAARGDEVELDLTGDDAEPAAEAIRELIERNFDSDLVPETGAVGVFGIAIGPAVVVPTPDAASASDVGPAATPEEEHARVLAAFVRVEREVSELVLALAPGERELFEPEAAIVHALHPRVLERVDAGASAEDAVRAATEGAATDLVHDARARLLDALTGAFAWELTADAEAIVVTDALTPSLVTRLPKTVAGIVAGFEEEAQVGFTSHAAILARGRAIPLAFVPTHVSAAITTGDTLVIDTTEASARVWISPSPAFVDTARAKQQAFRQTQVEDEVRSHASLAHLGVAVRVNVGSLADTIPGVAEGIGLLRTELLFAGRAAAPLEHEQLASVIAIARRVSGPLVARLFDAGGDKPLPWLAAPPDALDARGIELLLRYPSVLDAQLRAVTRAAEAADVRILLPLVRGPEDVTAVRARLERPVPIGAMIETPAAVDRIDTIAAAADFVCVGTNDLTALVLGVSRADAMASVDRRVVGLVRRIVEGAHTRGIQVTVCGEMAGDEHGAQILVGLGVDALSVAPMRVAPIRICLSQVTREVCEHAALDAMR